MKPEQLEIERLRKEVAKLRAERDVLKRSPPTLRGRDMTFAFIAKHRSIWPVAWLCEALGVSRSGFHAWLNRSPSQHAQYDETLLDNIKDSFKDSDRTGCARRVWRDLLAEGLAWGLHRVERLMRDNALRARPRRRGFPKDEGERPVIMSNVLTYSSRQPDRTRSGWPILPIYGRLRAGSMWLPSSTCSRDVLLAGR